MAQLTRQALMLVLAGILLASQAAQAQTCVQRNGVFAYGPPSGGATTVAWHATRASPACTGFSLGDDEWSDIAFPGGVTFPFGGVSISSVRTYSNGMLAFATNMHRSTTPAHRNWPNVTGGTINARTSIVAGAMTARHSFANESRVTFGLSDNNTGALNIDVTSGTITERLNAGAVCVSSDCVTGAVGNVVVVVNGLAGGVPVVAPGTAAVVARIGAFALAAPGVSGTVNISQNAPIYLPSTIARATFGIFSNPPNLPPQELLMQIDIEFFRYWANAVQSVT